MGLKGLEVLSPRLSDRPRQGAGRPHRQPPSYVPGPPKRIAPCFALESLIGLSVAGDTSQARPGSGALCHVPTGLAAFSKVAESMKPGTSTGHAVFASHLAAGL
jgi:hypothetical protein